MNWSLAGQLTTVVIASVAILAVIVKRANEYRKRETVEVEQAQRRDVVSEIPQWQWRPLNDAESENVDDMGIYSLVHEISRQAQM